MLSLYEGQYKLFGDPEVMPVKVIWDYTVYWGLMCPIFMQGRLTDVMLMARLGDTLNHIQAINLAMQQFLRAWGEVSERRNAAVMLDQASLPWFHELNRGLRDTLEGAAFDQRIAENIQLINSLAEQTFAKAIADYPLLAASDSAQSSRKLLAAHQSRCSAGEMGDEALLFEAKLQVAA
jgi:hypothetical protein